MFIDSHCHIHTFVNDDEVPDVTLESILADADEHNIEKMLCVACTASEWQMMKKLCEPHKDRFVLSAGIHPCDIDGQDFSAVEEQVLDSQVVAVGETGLDYYWVKDVAQQKLQRENLARHIDLAARVQKPLIIHTRDASTDTIAVLQSENAERSRGVMHSFTGDKEMAKQALDLDFYISFSGILTFKNAQEIRDVCQYVPLDRILIETDSPYLAPVPKRGKTNRPCWVRFVAQQIAEIKDLTTEEIGAITTDNFYSLFTKAVS